jgi:hypothetical protein
LPFSPAPTVKGWTFGSGNYQWVATGATPYHASPDTAPTAVTLTGVSGSFPVTFQPYSITVLQFTQQLPPTSIPTPTPTFTVTPTPSGTPPTPTLSPTATDTAAFTATPINVNILFPNPVLDKTPLSFFYLLASPAQQVRVKLFTTAFRKVFEEDGLVYSPGTHLYTLDWGKAGLNISNGLYYVVFYTRTGGSETHRVMKLLVQR